jgi:hypothetical protein
MVMVYRFRMWDVAADGFTLSTRWATRERIQAMGGERVGGGVEVPDEWVGGEIAGMTARGFDPLSPSASKS